MAVSFFAGCFVCFWVRVNEEIRSSYKVRMGGCDSLNQKGGVCLLFGFVTASSDIPRQ